MRTTRILLGGFLLLAVSAAGLLYWSFSEPEIEDLIEQATEAIEKQDGGRAFAVTQRILRREPHNAKGLFLSAVVAAENGDYPEAVDYCLRVASESDSIFVDARVMAGNICLEKLGFVSKAEACFREALAENPDHLVANERLVHILGLQTRSWDLLPHQLRVLRQSARAATQIQLLMQGELAYPDEEYVQQLRRTDIDCAGLALARAHIKVLGKQFVEAKNFCKRAIALQSDFPEAHAKLGQILIQIGSEEELIAWQAALPESAWSLIAAQAPAPPAWALSSLESFGSRIPKLSLARTQIASNPAMKIDLSEFPQPRDVATTSGDSGYEAGGIKSEARISFVDEATSVGLKFQDDNGMMQPRDQQIRPYDFTGGGIAVLDLNCDGWPDVFLSQGAGGLPGTIAATDSESSDQLFLNRIGTSFLGISDHALIAVSDYSQGASVGDLDSDGFDDLLIANLGRNRLLRNNGDGTFDDISSSIDGDRHDWTTSCLICDLNQDGHPDLYFVNYLGGDVLTRICSDREQRYVGCSPRDFPAAQDQIFINDGTGQFRDATADSGVMVPEGKGLGIIAADFNADRRIDLFISNDGVPNFLFENETV